MNARENTVVLKGVDKNNKDVVLFVPNSLAYDMATVTDDDGATATDSMTLTVTEASLDNDNDFICAIFTKKIHCKT